MPGLHATSSHEGARCPPCRARSAGPGAAAPCWHAPFGWLFAPTHLAQCASLLAGTASDVRAFACRCAKLAAFRDVTRRSNPRDGLPCRYHALVRPVQRRSPSDPPNGSSTHLLRCPLSLGIATLAIGSSYRNASRRRVSAVRRWRAAKQPHKTGCGVPCSHLPTGVATALQASSNTYLTGVHHGNKEPAPWRQGQRSDEGK